MMMIRSVIYIIFSDSFVQWLNCWGTRRNTVPHLQFLVQRVPPNSQKTQQ